jgi:tannase/feruloyl esterase
VNATSPDLNAFRSRGGKIMMYSGWADPVGPPLDAIDYYKRVEQGTGGQQNTESFFRLFMVPGMAHCGDGPGPNVFGGYGPSVPLSCDLSARKSDWHFLAAESISPNSRVPLRVASRGSVCRSV